MIARSSDFCGPGVSLPSLGERVFGSFRELVETVAGLYGIREVVQNVEVGLCSLQHLKHAGQRLNATLWEIPLPVEAQWKSQPFDRWLELRIDARLVAARIDAVPTVVAQMDCVQTVQTEGAALIGDAQPLIAERRWNSVGSRERREQMALRVAIAGAVSQDLRRPRPQ